MFLGVRPKCDLTPMKKLDSLRASSSLISCRSHGISAINLAKLQLTLVRLIGNWGETSGKFVIIPLRHFKQVFCCFCFVSQDISFRTQTGNDLMKESGLNISA